MNFLVTVESERSMLEGLLEAESREQHCFSAAGLEGMFIQ